MEVFFWSFLGLGFIFWVTGWSMALRFRGVPKHDCPSLTKVSVVIPARDEERNLARLLPSLFEQDSPPHEVIVVNDQSSDCTTDVAKEAGATVEDGLANRGRVSKARRLPRATGSFSLIPTP